jgi:hypothetical protein
MKTLVVYFHGLGGSPNSSKVKDLRDAGFLVEAPSIPVDPVKAEATLDDFLDRVITKHYYDGSFTKVVFVGTSLGGFWAARMGEKWDATQVLVNPAMSPEISLKKYLDSGYVDYQTNTSKSMTCEIVESFNKYSSKGSLVNRHFFIAKNDQVVDPYDVPEYHPYKRFYDSADHQGNSFFDDVVEYVKTL